MSVYVPPLPMTQMTADTAEELWHAARKVGMEADDILVRLDVRTRGLVVSMGAIELSRREFVAKLDEINDNGRGFGPKLAQICR